MTIKALTFDVFGTVVDWRTAVIGELTALGAARGVDGDWAEFADAWKASYTPALRRVNDRGTSILLVEQNVHMALELADRAYVIENGRIVLEGSGPEMLKDAHVKEAYLGQIGSE